MLSETYLARRNATVWNVPKTFNFGVDVVDRTAMAADGPAMFWENEAGDSAAFTFLTFFFRFFSSKVGFDVTADDIA